MRGCVHLGRVGDGNNAKRGNGATEYDVPRAANGLQTVLVVIVVFTELEGAPIQLYGTPTVKTVGRLTGQIRNIVQGSGIPKIGRCWREN